jgi:hypothetical protein
VVIAARGTSAATAHLQQRQNKTQHAQGFAKRLIISPECTFGSGEVSEVENTVPIPTKAGWIAQCEKQSGFTGSTIISSVNCWLIAMHKLWAGTRILGVARGGFC